VEGEDASAKYPIKKGPEHLSTFHVMPFTHLVYSVTWYSLSAAAAVGTYLRFRWPAAHDLPGRLSRRLHRRR
jgi:cytochrome oxidase assembly protein ShyY1